MVGFPYKLQNQVFTLIVIILLFPIIPLSVKKFGTILARLITGKK